MSSSGIGLVFGRTIEAELQDAVDARTWLGFVVDVRKRLVVAVRVAVRITRRWPANLAQILVGDTTAASSEQLGEIDLPKKSVAFSLRNADASGGLSLQQRLQ